MIVSKSNLIDYYLNLIWNGADREQAVEQTAKQFGVSHSCVIETIGGNSEKKY